MKKEIKDSLVINKEKGKVLHLLFPQETIRFIDYTESLTDKILKRKEKMPKVLLEDSSFWDDFKKYNSQFANSHRKNIVEDSDIFSDFYFNQESLPFTVYSLYKYINSPQCYNLKFNKLATCLFEFDE